MKIILILLVLITASISWAGEDQIVVDGALGQFGSRGGSLAQDKFAKLGLQEDLIGPLKQRLNVGGWLDLRGPGYNSAAFGGYQIGFEVTNDLFQGSIWSGPALITTTDQDLGSYFELNETLYFGIVDKSSDSIGLAYNHFSDAGLTAINRGKDYLGLEIKFPFSE